MAIVLGPVSEVGGSAPDRQAARCGLAVGTAKVPQQRAGPMNTCNQILLGSLSKTEGRGVRSAAASQ